VKDIAASTLIIAKRSDSEPSRGASGALSAPTADGPIDRLPPPMNGIVSEAVIERECGGERLCAIA
jgi:hypothetical protein